MIDVFQPLFEVTENPQSHPELHIFLQRVVGFDRRVQVSFSLNATDGFSASMTRARTSDDFTESSQCQSSGTLHRTLHTAIGKIFVQNSRPLFDVQSRLYHLYANMSSLNHWRAHLGFSKSFDRQSDMICSLDKKTPSCCGLMLEKQEMLTISPLLTSHPNQFLMESSSGKYRRCNIYII